MRVKRRRDPWKGLLAGALGGFAGSFAMSLLHALLQRGDASSRQPMEDSTVKAANAISQCVFQHELKEQQKKIAAPVVHYSFGASVGAIYGTLTESRRVMRAGWGLPFGAVVWLAAHAIAVPALDLSEPLIKSSLGSEAAEFGAHLVYGVTVESVRRFLRRGCSAARCPAGKRIAMVVTSSVLSILLASVAFGHESRPATSLSK